MSDMKLWLPRIADPIDDQPLRVRPLDRHDVRMKRAHRLRQIVNAVNLTTLTGLAVAKAGRARLSKGPDGLVYGTGYRFGFPLGGAFTVGNVVVSRRPVERLMSDTGLLAHEARHSTQYAVLGPFFWPLYVLGVIWSYVRTGDHWSRNPFERLAVLTDGHYVEATTVAPWVAARLAAGRVHSTLPSRKSTGQR
jgi:hypothetical protein